MKKANKKSGPKTSNVEDSPNSDDYQILDIESLLAVEGGGDIVANENGFGQCILSSDIGYNAEAKL